ncbi:MAG: hypothetical protein RBU25_19335 [Lentisphaeria bacterium]|jgi:hypothetical protein|nr:hypothetical protein [Lentisphaeria bacterium]
MSTLPDKTPAARLKEIVESGIAVDILDADRAWFLVEELCDRELPSSAQSFADALKGLAVVHLTLAVVKLFEKPKGYPLRNIPQALDLLAQGAHELTIGNRPAVEARLGRRFRIPPGLPDAELNRQIEARFRETLPNCDYIGTNLESCRTLEDLKTWRDKRMAHPEAAHADTFRAIELHAVWRLLSYAKGFIGVVGLAYTAVAYDTDDGHYFLSDDAKQAAMAFRRMVKGSAEPQGGGYSLSAARPSKPTP